MDKGCVQAENRSRQVSSRIQQGLWDSDPASPSDKQLLNYIQRANLDIFWACAISIVNGMVLGMKKGLMLADDLGIPQSYPPCDPWPLFDTVGFSVALQVYREGFHFEGDWGLEWCMGWDICPNLGLDYQVLHVILQNIDKD
eukprot:12032645-Ditylum_brightwellii.AAC.1